VREPAPFVIGTGEAPVATPQPSPPPEPSVDVEAPEDAGQPRRTGWWSRRIMGKS
jgi:hypothetical protein